MKSLELRVTDSLERSRRILRQRLGRAHGGELALLVLAAVHDEVPGDDKVFDQALHRLQQARLGRTYDLALRLMVASEWAAFPHRKETAVRDARRLLDHAYKGGGFGYHRGDRRWDLSNTQYAALGLRAAVSLGVVVRKQDWLGILRAVISAQTDDRGFGYTTHRKGATASMTVAGIAVLRICADHLDDKTLGRYDVEQRLDAAWRWLVDHKGQIGSKQTPNSLYFHYGLERASILSDVTQIDGKDWYRAGAEMLLRMQLQNGGWHSPRDIVMGKGDDGADSVSTAFAILFLRRKFQKHLVTGPITTGGGVPIQLLTPQATPAQVQTSIDSAVLRGAVALPEVLRALRSLIKIQRVAAAKAMIRITGEDFGYNPHTSPEHNGAAIKQAELWSFRASAEAKAGRADAGGRTADGDKARAAGAGKVRRNR